MSVVTTPRRRSSRLRVERVLNVINESDEESSSHSESTRSPGTSDEDDERPFLITPSKKRAKVSRQVQRKTHQPKSTPSKTRQPKTTPSKTRTKKKNIISPHNVASWAVDDESSREQLTVIELIRDFSKKTEAFKASVADWNALNSADPENAIASIVSFTIHVCGSSLFVPAAVLNNDLTDPALLSQFESDAKSNNTMQDLNNPNKSAAKRFHSRVKLWIKMWIESLPSTTLFDTELLCRVIEWVTVLSQNGLRSFRLGASAVAFAIADSLMSLYGQIQTQLALVMKSLSQKKKHAGSLQQLEGDRDEHNACSTALQNHINTIFQDIFVPRYRDVHHSVRELCLESLTCWILSYRVFVADAYFKYIGWALNNSHHQVRNIAVRSISELVKSDLVRPSMVSFLNRFIGRIIEMHYDIDEAVTSNAIETCTTILVHDDILSDYDSFGDVASLLWDKSKSIREAAAHYIYEDSFNADGTDESFTRSTPQDDIEQLYTIYCEAAPKEGRTDVYVQTLVELLFFKLPCLRDVVTMLSVLSSCSERDDGVINNGPPRQHFVAQLLLASFNFANLGQDQGHSRLTKVHAAQKRSTWESFQGIIASSEFHGIINKYQSEPEVIACLSKMITSILQKSDAERAITCNPAISPVLSTIFLRETNPLFLCPLSAALSAVSKADLASERAIQTLVENLVKSSQELKDDMDEDSVEHLLLTNANYARISSIVQQVYCPVVLNSRFYDEALTEIINGGFDALLEIHIGIIESLIKIAHCSILWGLRENHDIEHTQWRFQALVNSLCKVLSWEDSALTSLSCSVSADLSAASLSRAKFRYCLNDELFHLLRHHVRNNPGCVEAAKSAVRVVCCFCPEHVSIASTLFFNNAVNASTDEMNLLCKALISYLRVRKPQVLAQAILETLQECFRGDHVKEASAFARKVAMSHGLSAPTNSGFDTIVIGGIDHFLLSSCDSSFLALLLPFLQRCPKNLLEKVSQHITNTLEADEQSLDDSVRTQLLELQQVTVKRGLANNLPAHNQCDNATSVNDNVSVPESS